MCLSQYVDFSRHPAFYALSIASYQFFENSIFWERYIRFGFNFENVLEII
jgi:hypothetical protein